VFKRDWNSAFAERLALWYSTFSTSGANPFECFIWELWSWMLTSPNEPILTSPNQPTVWLSPNTYVGTCGEYLDPAGARGAVKSDVFT
jgi:hypothetical protein